MLALSVVALLVLSSRCGDDDGEDTAVGGDVAGSGDIGESDPDSGDLGPPDADPSLDGADGLGDAPPDTVGGDVPGDLLDDPDAADAPSLPFPPPGPGYHRDGTFLLDEAGRVLILHGANASNYTKRDPDRLTWHTAADFQALADAGFNGVRLLTSWAAVMPEPDEVDATYLDALAERVDWAWDAGLIVILDMHQDLFGYGFEGGNGAPAWACDEALYAAYEPMSPWWMNYLSPQVQACFDHLYTDDATFERFVDAWVAVAERLGDHPAVLGFDLLNEPHFGTYHVNRFVPEVWQPRQEQLAEAILAVAPDRVALFEGPPLHYVLGRAHLFEPAADPRVALAPHYYHNTVHEGGDFAPSMRDDIRAAFSAIALSAERLGDVPAWMGEFGGPNENPTVPAYLEAVLEELAARGWGWAVWSDDRGGGFSIRDADGVFRPALTTPLTHPYARRVPGPLVEQRLDFEAQQLVARFVWVRDADLELWVGVEAPADVRLLAIDDGEAKDASGDAGEEGDGDDEVACQASDGATTGVWVCSSGADGVVFGRTYELTLSW